MCKICTILTASWFGFYLKIFGEKHTYLIKLIKCPSIRKINLMEFHCITFFLVYVTKIRVRGINMAICVFINAFLVM